MQVITETENRIEERREIKDNCNEKVGFQGLFSTLIKINIGWYSNDGNKENS